MSFKQSDELTITYSDPLWYSSRQGEIRFEPDDYEHEIRAIGGYFSSRLTLTVDQNTIDDWVEYGLGRHIKSYSPAQVQIWEGFVNKISASLGGFRFTIGPLLDVANRVYVIYSTIDTSTDPPTLGVRAQTSKSNDTDSQARYGIIETAESIGGTTATQAALARDLVLTERAFPPTSRASSLGGSGLNMQIECLGYWHWLKTYYYTLATTGDVNLSDKIRAILGAEPNTGIFSTDYSKITSNTVQVGAGNAGDKTSESILKSLLKLGDVSNNVYNAGFYNGRQFVYETAPTAVEYLQRIGDNKGISNVIGSEIEAWNVLPGKWLFYPDFLIGRHPPVTTSTLNSDPRAGYIEVVKFKYPDSLSLNSEKLSQFDQLAAKIGVGA